MFRMNRSSLVERRTRACFAPLCRLMFCNASCTIRTTSRQACGDKLISSTDGVNWYEVPNTPWQPRHAASVFVHDNALWMVAGNNMTSDVWKLQRRFPAKP